jgi:hypothetical protein
VGTGVKVTRGPSTVARIRSLAAGGALCALVALLWAAAARADERVYWANTAANTISYAAVDGAGGGNLNTMGAPISAPVGIVLDPVGGRTYWANSNGSTIGWAKLDGTGGGTLNTTGTTVNKPSALTVNPATRTLYWSNSTALNDLSYARLDGSGGGDLAVPNSTTEGGDAGMTFDPVSQRFYWADPQSGLHGNIGYETLGAGAAGAGSLNTGTVATLNYPFAIADNNGDGFAYWTNDNGKIGEVRTDIAGLGSGNLNTTGATTTSIPGGVPLNLTGIAIDERHFRVYWGGSWNGGTNRISYARLDNSGGADVDTTGATVSQPGGVALLDVPAPGLAPTIAGTPVTGSTLTCRQGSWQPDDTAAFYWRSPSSYAYAWTLNGVAINNQTNSNLTPARAGLYTCTITARNAAGSAASTSKPVQVTASSAPGGGGPTGPGGGGSGGGPGSTNAPPLALGRIHQSHRSWASHRYRAQPGGAKPPPYGTAFTTTVNRAATLAFSFAALRRGRIGKHHCVKPTADNRGARGCTRAVAPGTMIRKPTSAGTVKLMFRGRLNHRTLAPGRYRLTITATASSSPRRSRRISFAVVGPPGQA